jgi:tRNA(Ile2) C34 agmatinyltransferase TiaS
MPLLARDDNDNPICPYCQGRMRVNDDRAWMVGAAKQYICTSCGKTAVDSALKRGNPRRNPVKVVRPKPPNCPTCGKRLLSAGKTKWYCNPTRTNKAGVTGCGAVFLRTELEGDNRPTLDG